MILNKKIANTGVVLAFIAVLLGAFGAHGLKEMASAETVLSFNTGVRYQMYHALALVLVSLLPLPVKRLTWAYNFFLIGVVLFSGSIYGLTAAAVLNTGLGMFALLTPLGGICLLMGWAILFISLLKMSKSKSQ